MITVMTGADRVLREAAQLSVFGHVLNWPSVDYATGWDLESL